MKHRIFPILFLAVGLMAVSAAIFCWTNPIVGYADVTYRMVAESIDQGFGFRVWEIPEHADWLGNYMTPAGYIPLHHTIGRSLVALPFLKFSGGIFREGRVWGLNPGDYVFGGAIYRSVYNLPGLLAAIIALFVIFQTCRLYAGAMTAALGTALAVSASYFFLVLLVHHSGADGPLMLIIALAVHQAARWDKGFSPGLGSWFFLGLLSGLAPFFRLQGIVCLGIPCALLLVGFWKGRRRETPVRFLNILGGFTLGLLPVLVYQHYYFGIWTLTYSFGTTGQSWTEIIHVLLYLSPHLLESPVFLAGVLALALYVRRSPGVALGGLSMVVGSLLMMALYRGWENQCWSGGRFPMLLLPFAALGITGLLKRLAPAVRVFVFIAGATVNLLGPLSRYLGECSLVFRHSYPSFRWCSQCLSNEAGYSFISPGTLASMFPQLLRDLWYLVFMPKFRGSLFIAELVVLTGAILITSLFFLYKGTRQCACNLRGWVLSAGGVLFVAYSVLVIAWIGENDRKWIDLKSREGFYQGKWRNMVFDVFDEAGLAHGRSIIFRKLGNFPAARRQFHSSMVNWYGSTARVVFRELLEFQKTLSISGNLFEGMDRAPDAIWIFSDKNNPSESENRKAIDRNFGTSLRLSGVDGQRLGFGFDPARCSDIYIVMDSMSSADAVRVELGRGDEVRYEVIRDFLPEQPGTDSKPCMMQFGDTLWIRDVYQRRYDRGWVTFSDREEGVFIVELFAVMSPRHVLTCPE